MPASEQVGQKFGATPASLTSPMSITPNWQPAVKLQAPVTGGTTPTVPPVAVPNPSAAPSGVQLLPPQMGMAPSEAPLGEAPSGGAPSGFAPIGYPR
jgi:hypothetical protein